MQYPWYIFRIVETISRYLLLNILTNICRHWTFSTFLFSFQTFRFMKITPIFKKYSNNNSIIPFNSLTKDRLCFESSVENIVYIKLWPPPNFSIWKIRKKNWPRSTKIPGFPKLGMNLSSKIWPENMYLS